MNGRLFVVSGPSGAGKTSLCSALLKSCPGLRLSVSCTTRPPRPGELDGREYHFLSHADFTDQCKAGRFLEWANVHGHLYGTRQSDVEAILTGGNDVLVEIDWQGARQVAKKMPDVTRIFILPPSLQELRRRLIARGQDSAKTVTDRMAAAEAEMAHADEAHYKIVNADFDQTLSKLIHVFQATAHVTP
jgi:guanylate kinase